MTRDSYSNELLPFLYPHFSRIVLSHDQDGFWRPDLIDRFKPDIVVLEVVEPGLHVAMLGGPAPSAAAAPGIDGRLAKTRSSQGASLIPLLTTPDKARAADISAAGPARSCAVEGADLTPEGGGQASFAVSGWLLEPGRRVGPPPEGLVELPRSGRSWFAGPVSWDRPRPDVAAHFRNPNAQSSGFNTVFVIPTLPRGAYQTRVFRRAGSGWIACKAAQVVVAP